MAATTEPAQEQGTGSTIGTKPMADNYAIHDAKTIHEAGEINIKDEQGKGLPFKSLYEGQPGRQLIVFIRHFYCGSCEEYCRAVCSSLPPKTLASTNPPTKLIFVGCGHPEPIAGYRERTQSALKGGETFPIYCNPDRKLFEKFGMACNTINKPAEYITKSFTNLVLSSMKNGIMDGMNITKGGNPTQNGGEYLFENGELKWCHRMKITTDHAEIKDLKQVLGL